MGSHQNMTRRAFLKNASFSAFAFNVWLQHASAAITVPVIHPGPLNEFGYGDVHFGACLQQRQFEETMAVILGLNEDGVMKPFRIRAGMPAPGDDLGGWYDDDPKYDWQSGNEHGFAPGHSFGQWVSALCRAYAINGSVPMKQKAERLIALYTKTISPKFYEDFRFPTYTFDKINLALIDAHKYIQLPDAFSILAKLTDAALPFFPSRALDHDEMRALPHKNESYCWDESYTIPENLFLAFQRGAGTRYKNLAIRFLKDDTYFNPLSEGKNVLPDHHAYSYTNALSSAMQAYLTLGSQKHLLAAKNAFDMIRDTQSYATGGWGPDETFRKPETGALAESLTGTHKSFETPCGSYAHFKIARYLLRVTGDAGYGDSMEKVMYNTVLGAKKLQHDGQGFYYSDYNFDGKKVLRDKWTCCTGTLPQVTCDYHVCTYFHDLDGIYVNLYIPSTVSWFPKPKSSKSIVKLTQKSNYPFDETIDFEVTLDTPAEFVLHLRIPEWSSNAALTVNGKKVQANELLSAADRHGFASIRRKWNNGDRVELELPMKMRLEPVDSKNPNTVALVRGPLVLFGITSTKPKISKEQLLAAKRSKENEWIAQTEDGELRLLPFTAIDDEKYTTYFQVSS